MELLTPEYKALLTEMHETTGWGAGGHKRAANVNALAVGYGARHILDYGCGKGTLKRELVERWNWPVGVIREYDPGIPEKSELPEPADVVACTDVLEHIERDKLVAVIWHLFSLTQKAAYLLIVKQLSGKTLPDGRNAHLIVEPTAYWVDTLQIAPWSELEILDDDPKTLIIKAVK